jgi:hypothetical protein
MAGVGAGAGVLSWLADSFLRGSTGLDEIRKTANTMQIEPTISRPSLLNGKGAGSDFMVETSGQGCPLVINGDS